MNGVVGTERRADEKLRIQDVWIEVLEVLRTHRIHVVDVDPAVDWKVRMGELTALISENHFVTNLLPRRRGIEGLVQPTIRTKRRIPDLTFESQVTESLLERIQLHELGVGPSRRTHRNHHPPSVDDDPGRSSSP